MSMDPSWNSVTTDPSTLNQIAQSLGYPSADDLPPINSLTNDQMMTVTSNCPEDVAEKFYEATYNYSDPSIDPANVDTHKLATLISEIEHKLNQLMLQLDSESIKDNREDMHEQVQKRIQDITDFLKQHSAAKNHSKVGKWLGLAGAIVGVIVAATVAVLTGGAAIALVALAIAAVALTVTALQETGEMDKGLKAMGVPDKDVQWVEVGITAALMVASICTGIGAGAALAEMGSTIPGLISTVAEATEVSAEAIQAGAKVALAASTIIAALISIGGGSVGITAAVENYDATQTQGDITDIKAMIKYLQSLLQELEDAVKKQMQHQAKMVFDLPNDLLNIMTQQTLQVFAGEPA